MKQVFTFLLILSFTSLFSQISEKATNNFHICSHHKSFSSKELPSTNPLLQSYDIKYMKPDLNVSIHTSYISGSVEIISLALENINNFVLEFNDSTMIVDSVLVNDTLRIFTHNNSEINTNVQIQNGDLFNSIIYYHGTPYSDRYTRGVINNLDNTYFLKTTWTLSESYHLADWLPCKQDLKDKIDSAEFFITIDTSLMAGSNGLLKNITILQNGKHRFEWETHYPMDYYLISFAVADYTEYNIYAHPQGLSDSILIQNYIYDTLDCLTDYKVEIDRTAEFIEVLSEKFGMYPFKDEKYGHCMVEVGGGMEHQTMTTLGYFSVGLVSHELGHSWFGNSVTCATWQDIWINEGFATYSEYLAREFTGLTQEANDWLVFVHNKALEYDNGSIYVPFAELDSESRIFDNRLSYKKGGSIIHMMRYIIDNDSIFFQTLKDFQNIYKDSVATGDDFLNIINTTSGIDFTTFFDQWYYGEGYPIYNIYWSQNNDTLKIENTQTTSAAITPLYNVPVEFKIYTLNSDTIIRFNQNQNTENYTVYFSENITNIEFDPDNWLLKKVDTILNIQNFTIDNNIKIYPNPAHDFVFVKSSKLKVESCSVLDVYGRTIQEFKIQNSEFKIQIEDLSNGIYFIKLETENNIFVKKFVKK